MSESIDHVFAAMSLPHSGALLSTPWPDSRITAARFRSLQPNGLVKRLAAQDAFVLITRIGDLPQNETGESQGALNIFNLGESPSCRKIRPFDDLYFHFPRTALDRIADEAKAPPIAALRAPDGWNTTDPVVRQITGCVLGSLEQPDAINQLFLDYTMLALLAHLARVYGGMRDGARRCAGGLAPWQERRAKEMIAAHLGNSLSIEAIARECGLSASHFARAFRQSTGTTPHEWLQECRVDRAKTLLGDPELTLATIAVACGFADQSHFTKVFGRIAGMTPGRWRRGLPRV
jgi:AraC-like DNA-binding protein